MRIDLAADAAQIQLDNFALEPPEEPRVAVIRTSDRLGFRTCRRRWGIESHMKRNMEPNQKASPLWFGTGIHFALEDHGCDKLYPKASAAFTDYVYATRKHFGEDNLPDDYMYWADAGVKMLDYYTDQWLETRDPLETYVVDGVKQVEINFNIEIPFDLKARGWDKWWSKVVYSGTIDRIVIDENGHLWLLDYKTAKSIKTTHFLNDTQITAYLWAASRIYDRPIMGMIYQQHLKKPIEPLQPMKSGKLTTNQTTVTTTKQYKEAMDRIYTKEGFAVPPDCEAFYRRLQETETADADRFIRRDRLYKNEHSFEAEGTKIMLELEDMLNPALPLYPNPHFMICKQMCSMYEICVSMDDGTDWEHQLNTGWRVKPPRDDESWKNLLRGPNRDAPAFA